MLDDRAIAELMSAATSVSGEGSKDAFGRMLSSLSPDDMQFFKGYVSGYSDACRDAFKAVSLNDDGTVRKEP